MKMRTVLMILAAFLLLSVGCDRQATSEQITGNEAGGVQTMPAGHPPAGGSMVAGGAPHGPGGPGAMPELRNGEVVETMDAGGYTYVQLKTDSGTFWAAGPQTAVKVGDKVGVPPGAMMKDFASPTLGRTFPEIEFVGIIQMGGQMGGADAVQQAHAGAAKPADAAPAVVDVAKLDGGVTVEEIYTKKAELAGQDVSLRGQVVKFNAQIMGTNWIHLRDGSGTADGSTNDLTVTTAATVAVGDTVVVKGKLTADKDFGAGYAFSVIIENAEVTKE